MPKRIFLVHAYLPSMAPIDRAFKAAWPQAQTLNLVDESLYADVPADGALSPALHQRVESLLRHCELSGADGVVFTGTTFGPAVELVRAQMKIPVLKADEAMAERVVELGGRTLLACTQQRAMRVVRAGLDAAAARAGVTLRIDELWVTDAKDATTAGRPEQHDRLIAEQVAAAAKDFDVIVLGQISMMPALSLLPPDLAGRTVTSPDAAVARMRVLLER